MLCDSFRVGFSQSYEIAVAVEKVRVCVNKGVLHQYPGNAESADRFADHVVIIAKLSGAVGKFVDSPAAAFFCLDAAAVQPQSGKFGYNRFSQSRALLVVFRLMFCIRYKDLAAVCAFVAGGIDVEADEDIRSDVSRHADTPAERGLAVCIVYSRVSHIHPDAFVLMQTVPAGKRDFQIDSRFAQTESFIDSAGVRASVSRVEHYDEVIFAPVVKVYHGGGYSCYDQCAAHDHHDHHARYPAGHGILGRLFFYGFFMIC